MLKEITIISFGALLVWLGAMIAFDLNLNETKIPITGQSLAVLMVGFLCGSRLGGLSIILYLLIGIIGFPVFANGASGIEVLTKGSGGFLYGFVFAAYLIGLISERAKEQSFVFCLFAMAIGTLVILIFGIAHLTYLFGFEKALEYGLVPFWKGAVVKILLGAIIVYGVSKIYEIFDVKKT